MLCITPYCFHKPVNNNCKNKMFYNTDLCCDKVSFGSKNILLYSEKKLQQVILDAIKPSNFLGKGFEGEVFKIPDTDYCIKIVDNFENLVFKNLRTSVTEEEKINHIVGVFDNDSFLMKYISGEPLLNIENRDIICSLPQESYIDFIKQLKKAKGNSMYFDISPGNVIYNPKTKKLTAIDFYPKTQDDNYSPFSRAFSALKVHNKTNDAIKLNRKLGVIFMQIGFDDLIGKNELKLTYEDFKSFFIRFGFSQNDTLPSQYKFLRQSVEELFKLKAIDAQDEEISNKINFKKKYIQCIINQIKNNIT